MTTDCKSKTVRAQILRKAVSYFAQDSSDEKYGDGAHDQQVDADNNKLKRGERCPGHIPHEQIDAYEERSVNGVQSAGDAS
jgi:hypothetical protein